MGTIGLWQVAGIVPMCHQGYVVWQACLHLLEGLVSLTLSQGCIAVSKPSIECRYASSSYTSRMAQALQHQHTCSAWVHDILGCKTENGIGAQHWPSQSEQDLILPALHTNTFKSF